MKGGEQAPWPGENRQPEDQPENREMEPMSEGKTKTPIPASMGPIPPNILIKVSSL
jgi:hypothetical protein